MKKRLTALLMSIPLMVAGVIILVSIPPALAAPSYVNSWSIGFGSVSSGALTVATTGGDTVVVMVATKSSTCTVSSITDNGASGGSAYSIRKGPVANTVDFEIWGTAVGAAVAATQVTVNLGGAGAPCKMAFAVGDYSGVTAYGNSNTGTGSGANPGPIAVTVQEANGAIVGGFATNDGTAQTALTGNLRQAATCLATGGSASTRVGCSLVDLLSQTAGSHSLQTTHAAIAWAGAVIELRNQTPCTTAPTITYNNGQTKVGWAALVATQNNQAADGQGATAAITVTQNGPGTCSIAVSLQAAAPSGVTAKVATSNSPPAVGSGTVPVLPSTIVMCSSIATGATCNIWWWTDSVNAGAGTFSPGFTITES